MINRIQLIGLMLGGIAALASSLSAHAFMLEYLHVPSPHLPHSAWVRLPDHIMQTFGLIGAYLLTSIKLRATPVKCAAVLLLIYLMVTEILFRDPFMEVVNLSNLTLYPFLDVVPLYLTAATVVFGIVAARRCLSTWAGKAAACIGIAALAYLVVAPLVNTAFVPVHAWTAMQEGHGLYDPPYNWRILVPAYLTFAEPVIGALLLCALTSSRLPPTAWKAWAVLAGVIFALRGVFFGCFLNMLFVPAHPVTALLSQGQFGIENALLAAIVAATWVLVTRGEAGESGRSFQRRANRSK